MKIDTICNSLLETLIQAGYNENTIFNYRGVIRRFKAFCKEKEAFEYTPELGQSYADDVISKKKQGSSANSVISHREGLQDC